MRKHLGILMLIAAWWLVRGLTAPQVCNSCCVLEAPPSAEPLIIRGSGFNSDRVLPALPMRDAWQFESRIKQADLGQWREATAAGWLPDSGNVFSEYDLMPPRTKSD